MTGVRACERCEREYEPRPMSAGGDGLVWCDRCIAEVSRPGGAGPDVEAALRAGVPTGTGALTDTGNAERFADGQRARWRYAEGRGWLGWDGLRWADNADGAMAATKQTARAIRDEAALATDRSERDALTKHAHHTESEPARRAMLKLAKTEDSLRVTADQLDADAFQLVVMNGTLCLRTGQLGPSEPAHLNTRLAPVTWVPGVTHPALDRLLGDVTGGDDDLEAYLARCVGYSLTGSTREEKLFVPHGPGGSGKSTLVDAVRAMLGDYASSVDPETFLARREGHGARADLARLAGVRMAIAVEPGDENRRLDTAVVKWVTGGDPIVARHLYRDPFEFVPAFKLWLVTNHRPIVSRADTGMWRRLVELPFRHAVAEDRQDPELKHVLVHDPQARCALLNWAVAGCLDWQARQGLDPPAAVRQATADYRAEQDTVGRFVADCCVVRVDLSAEAGPLYAAYTEWAGLERVRLEPQKKFGQRLGELGFEARKGAQGRRLRDGLGLEAGGASGASGGGADNSLHVRAREGSYQHGATRATSRHRDGETTSTVAEAQAIFDDGPTASQNGDRP